MKMELRYVPLRCADLDRARRFYGGVLGLPETDIRAGEFVQYAIGGAELCVDLEHEGARTPAAIVAVDDLATLGARLAEAGVPVDAGGLERGWLQVRDPDGNALVFESR